MKFSRVLFAGFLAIGALVFAPACGIFEDSSDDGLSPYFDPNGNQLPAQEPIPGQRSYGQDAALQGGLAGGALAGPQDGAYSGAGAWGAEDLNAYPGGMGPRIQGVDFAPVYYPFDRFDIAQSEYQKIQMVAEYLLSNPGSGIVIEGKCDDRGTAEYNRALGERRALAAKEMLLQYGIEDERIATVSYGKERPAVSGAGEDVWSRNRRAEFVPVQMRR